MPEPWYNDNNKEELTLEKDDSEKKIVPKEKIATLDEVFAAEDSTEEEIVVTEAEKKYKHIIEIESDTHTIQVEILDALLGYYSIGNLTMMTKENKK
ncbi:MAG TPA: hypothetical protein VLA48_02040 [Nitrososphaeraceae archaeon]|nr:hypothetical protein [Nitrososphaeraceae archaeon]